MIPKRQRNALLFLLVILLSLLFALKADSLFAMPQVRRMVLPNQLVLLVSEEHSIPLVTLRLLVEAGSRRDPPGKEGLANMTANGLLLGTSSYSVTAFNEALDFMGASLGASAERDYATLTLRTLKKDLDRGFDLFMEALTRPTFPDDEVRRQTEKTLAAIQSAEERPGHVAGKAFRSALLPGSPYGHPVKGTEESLPRITRETILQFRRTFYHPNNAILAVVGDITLDEVRTRLIPRLSQWPRAMIPDEHFTPTFARGPETIAIERHITQANIILGHQGVSRNNPDYYALSVMNYILGGGGFGSRLMEEIRVKRGLAYSVVSYFAPGKYPGLFQVIVQTRNASAQETISLIRQEMERIQTEPVSGEELEKAKKYLIGSFPFRLDTQSKLASFLTQVEYHGLGLDYPEKHASYINAVTQDDVLRVARSYLDPEHAILVVVANLKEAGLE